MLFFSVKFLEIKNIYKILIIFSILALILFSAYYSYYFTEIGWLFGSFFAAGLVAVPFYLWMWYKAEKEEKDNALIQRMPTLQDYFNKNKKRFITNKKIFFIGLFGAFVSIWQIEVPQSIMLDLMDNKIEIFDNNYIVLKEKDKSNIDIEFDLDIPDLQLFEIYFRKVEIFAYDDINQTKNKRKIGEYKKPFMAESSLICFLTNIVSYGKCSTLTNKSKYQLNKGEITLADYLKQYQKGEKQ